MLLRRSNLVWHEDGPMSCVCQVRQAFLWVEILSSDGDQGQQGR